MSWNRRLVELTRWRPLGVSVDWDFLEVELGVRLPCDFKEMCETFGRGEFNEYIAPYGSSGGRHLEVLDRYHEILRVFQRDPETGTVYSPYGFFGLQRGGLLPWGWTTVEGGEFFWLTNSQNPDTWPTVVRSLSEDSWVVYDMPASEFVFRTLTESDIRYSAVSYSPHPVYSLYEQ